MSRFRLHTKAGKKLLLSYLMAGTACAIAAGVMGYMVHSVGITRAKSRETVLIYTEEELEQYLVDTESEEYNLNGRYQLEEDLDLSGLSASIGTNIEPFTGSFNGNGHVISGLTRPLFGVLKTARVEQLFLSEAMVVHPALYSDGQHYVDGYGALAAYAVDSTIQNCGMAGEIYTASPSEAEYQLAKASPSDAGEGGGPDFQGDLPVGEAQGGSQKETGDTVAGPGGETVTGTGGGPGVEGLERTEETGTMDEIGPGVESSKGEAGNSTAAGMEGTTSETDGTAADIESTETGGREEGATSGAGESPSDSYESTPGSQESISGGNESTPGSQESISGGNESTSGSHESISGGNESTLGSHEGTSGSYDSTSGSHEGASGSHESTLGGNESPSGSNDNTSGNHESTPDRHENKAAGNVSTPTGTDGNLPSGVEVSIGINTKENIQDKTAGNTGAGNGRSTTQGSSSGESTKEENTTDRGTTGRSKDTATSAWSISEPKPNRDSTTETVGCQAVDRRQLMLKISTITDVDAESVLPASPSDATPSDAATPTESGGQPGTGEENQSEAEPVEESLEYIGNSDGDIFILVTADRVTTGGLVAEAAGNTLISNCYALLTLGSELQEIETYSGGLAGILGAETRTENSYATGLADSDGVTGGLAADNKGMIENCFSTVTVGENGKVRGAFTAENSGTLIGCIYDRQIACVQEEPEQNQEQNVQEQELQEQELQNQDLQGLDTAQMIGQNPQIPGTWYTAEQAYPQIEYFAVHEKESISKSSRLSAIALVLPEGEMLTDVLHEEGIILPSQIDGQEILWKADGGIKINEDNQLTRESITISENEAPITQSALESSQPDTASQAVQPEDSQLKGTQTEASQTETSQTGDTQPESLQTEDSPVSTPEAKPQTVSQETFSLTAGMNDSGDTKVFRLRSAAREATAIAADWAEVGSWQTEEALRAADITMPDGTTRKMLAGGDGSSEENAYIINCPEALAWFAYKVNNDNNNFRKKCVRLNADIDLSGLGKDYTTITSVASDFSNCLPWIPIADNPWDSGQALTKTYDGTFDGGGYDIQNLYIIGGGFHTGFISTTRYGTVVKNVRIVSGYVRGTDRVAAIVGVLTGADGTLLIENCFNAARVESVLRSDGVACNTAAILGKTFGGHAEVKRCGNIGTISSYRECCGIAIGAALIEDCYNLGDVIQTGTYEGTRYFYGIGTGSVRNCFNAGAINATANISVIGDNAINSYYQTGLTGAIGGTEPFI